MKKILIVACLVIALCAGCKKPKAPEPATPTGEEPATASGLTTPATTAPGQTVPPAEPAPAVGQTVPPSPMALSLEERCELQKKEYYATVVDQLRVTLEYRTKMLAAKKSGSPTDALAAEMESKLSAAVLSHGFKSTADMNPEGCQLGPIQDPKVAADLQDLTVKLSEIEKQLQAP